VADSASAVSLDPDEELEETEGVRVMRGMVRWSGLGVLVSRQMSGLSEIWSDDLKHEGGIWFRD
jgi:hypothetical protein